MALRKITIQIEDLQYHRLRQESFDKHIPISELIRIHLEESKLPISHVKFFPGDLSQKDEVVSKFKEIATRPLNHQDEQEEIADVREQGKCEANKGACRNLGYLYRVTYIDNEGEHKEDRFLCNIHLQKTKDGGAEVTEI